MDTINKFLEQPTVIWVVLIVTVITVWRQNKAIIHLCDEIDLLKNNK